MPKLHTLLLAASALAALALIATVPAQAQVYYRPYGGVYVERYYQPLPPGAYYAPPPVYSAPPRAYRGPGRFPFADVGPMLRSMGMSGIGRARVDGDTYVVDATDGTGTRVRVRIDAFNGRILALHPTGQPPVARQSVPVAPTVPPLPPKKPPELAAVTVPASPPITDPQAPPPVAAPVVAAPVMPPEPPAVAAQPAPLPEEKPAIAATPPASDPGVRVIPGIAVPPGTEPKDDAENSPPPAPESAGAGTGTGTGTGSDTSAGTASVVARGAKPPKPAPAED